MLPYEFPRVYLLGGRCLLSVAWTDSEMLASYVDIKEKVQCSEFDVAIFKLEAKSLLGQRQKGDTSGLETLAVHDPMAVSAVTSLASL